MAVTRSTAEIEEQIDAAAQSTGTSRRAGMSYEDGVRAALDWVTGESDEPPMEDE